MDEYSVVYIGYPIWWYKAPSIINTFLESYNFAGKTIIPFATSGSSDFGDSEKLLYTHCDKTTKWEKGRILNGEINKSVLLDWIKGMQL